MFPVKAIESPFFQEDDVYEIYNGDFSLKTEKDQTYNVNGTITYSLTPVPSINFEGTLNKWMDTHRIFTEENVKLMVPEMISSDVIITRTKNNYIFGKVTGETGNSSAPFIDRYYLYVLNFIKFLGGSMYNENRYYAGASIIDHEEWDIQLQVRNDYKDKKIFEQLKESQGYRITHIIEVKRKDCSLFKKSDVKWIEEIFTSLLSLCAGRHIGIPIKTGMKEDEVIFHEYTQPIASPYVRKTNWFPKQRGGEIATIFNNLNDVFRDEFLKKSLKIIINWYITALNAQFLEHKIVNAQIALEKLSYILLTQQPFAVISKSKYGDNSFEKNMLMIFTAINVDTDLMDEFSLFKEQFRNGPHLLAKFRNHIVHPKRDQRFEEFNGLDTFKIYQLGIHYIEMLILYLIGYKRYFTNHLKLPSWEGEYEMVPWARMP